MAKREGSAPRGLAGLPLRVIEAELRRRGRSVAALERKRDRLMSRVEKLNRQIQELGGSASVGGGGGRGRRSDVGRVRPRNDMNLVEALAKVLNGKTMSVTDVTEAVQRAGYRTSSDNFRTIVNQTLIKSDRFKKVSRGQYTAK
jgi:hypothetical protein